ncbi:MAG: DUF4249 family protein [Porphyromonas sp.]|nr:DUF4249 family protein [Porphyromonas sp.]
MMDKVTILLVPFALLFYSCSSGSRELDVPNSEHLYMNAIAPHSSLHLEVETGVTLPIIGGDAKQERKIELTALHNNEPVVEKRTSSGFVLQLDRRLDVGDKIRLTATSEKLPPVYAEAQVLEAPKLYGATGEWITSEEGMRRVQVQLSIEPTKEVAYYRVIVRSDWYSESIGMPVPELKEREIITFGNPLFPQPKDQLFNEASNAPFALISTQNQSDLIFSYYDVKIENSSEAPFQIDWKYTAQVELQRISKDYYLYLLTCMESDNNNAFENPIKVHSNVRGGFGIFEIYSPAITTLSIQ